MSRILRECDCTNPICIRRRVTFLNKNKLNKIIRVVCHKCYSIVLKDPNYPLTEQLNSRSVESLKVCNCCAQTNIDSIPWTELGIDDDID